MDWDDLRVFLGVARAQSLSGASTGLRMDPATLSRRIARLEAATGTALFLKSPQGYALTDAGGRLTQHAEAMERAARAGLLQLDDTQQGLRGTLRIGAPDGVANYVLPQVCARITRAHPALDIQIVALPRVFNLSRREADLAIAVSAPAAGQLLVQKLCAYRLSWAAHRDYLAGAPALSTAADLQNHPIIGYVPDMIFDPELDFLSDLSLTPSIASNSAAVQVQLLQSGAGVGVIHDFAYPSAPDLVRVLPDAPPKPRAFYLLRHKDEATQPRSKRLADLVARGVRAEVARLEAQFP